MGSRTAGHGRPYDYLYDPVCQVSSVRDHVKAMRQAQTHDVIINPNYDNMFSALRHYPPANYKFRPHNLPESLGEDRRVIYGPAQVDGANRYKYFRRPIIPYMPSLGGQIVYARKAAPAIQPAVERPATPPTRTIAIQTIFRESEAQTDPYSPEYILQPGAAPPELLALATLTYGMGLPAGMSELEMIERARTKRAWEAMLPRVVDQESFEKRLKMMEEMELREWQDRENEIRRLQEARLQILSKVISKREEENERLNNDRVERIWQRKLQERETMLEKIAIKRVKAIRKLTEKRNKVENKIERRDIIAEYANYSSKVYAPRARDGVISDRSAYGPHLSITELESYEGLLELEAAMPLSALNADISLPDSSGKLRNPSARRELHMQEQLRLMDLKLKERKMQTEADERPLRFAQKIEKPPQRPPTPRITEPSEEEEKLELAAIFLQKLIRGRVAQNLMYHGKERRLQLIGELRTRQTIKRAAEVEGGGAAFVNAEGEDNDGWPLVNGRVSATSNSKAPSRRGESPASNVADPEVASVRGDGDEFIAETVDVTSSQWIEQLFESNIQAEYVGRTLDFLSKEIVRLREERRISAMVKLAERTRKMREAEELDRRKSELQRRKEEDEVFRRVMHIHQETVDSYLEDIIAESVDETSSLLARKQVREYAVKINELLDEIEKRDSDPRRTVEDLVVSFLIPEVEKENLRHLVKNEQRRYLLAAHRSIYSELSGIEDKAHASDSATTPSDSAK